jgi:hypothetical protein
MLNMKTIFKILVILVVAVLVGGMLYGVVTAASSGVDQSSIAERPTDGQFPADGEFSPPDRDDLDGGIQFPADAIKNLAIISIVSVIYLNAPKLLGRKKQALQAAR